MTPADHRFTLLVIDDDRIFCDTIGDVFQGENFEVLTAHNRRDGLAACAREKIDVVLLDQKLPDSDGHLLCPDILKYNDDTRIIFATAYPSFDNAVRAIKAGAHDYLSKPFELEELRLAINRSIQFLELERVKHVESYRSSKDKDRNILVGSFGKSLDIGKLIRMAASVDSPVLLTGETGTGKNMVAKAIHYRDAHKSSPFISTNCAAFPETLIEDELFGHEKGAFTDARAARKGLFEIAKGGTLLLDEIGEMPIHLQSKLLGVLDEGLIRRLGGQSTIPVSVRIIAATNANLEERITSNQFRQDLYYRLSVIRIHLPPLRERREDIPELCDFFIKQMAMGKTVAIGDSEIKTLMAYSWPGNIRELRNIIERSLLLHGCHLRPSELIENRFPGTNNDTTPTLTPVVDEQLKSLEQVELEHIQRSLHACSFNLTRCAEVLGISLSTLKRKVKRFGLKRKAG